VIGVWPFESEKQVLEVVLTVKDVLDLPADQYPVKPINRSLQKATAIPFVSMNRRQIVPYRYKVGRSTGWSPTSPVACNGQCDFSAQLLALDPNAWTVPPAQGSFEWFRNCRRANLFRICARTRRVWDYAAGHETGFRLSKIRIVELTAFDAVWLSRDRGFPQSCSSRFLPRPENLFRSHLPPL
jgi:hypothetical protein